MHDARRVVERNDARMRRCGSLARTGVAVFTVFVGIVAAHPDAAVSKMRDGLIAYTTGNGEEEPYAIWTIHPDGTGNHRLLGADRRFQGGPSAPRWSRDGRWLLFRRMFSRAGVGSSLWYMTAGGHHLRSIPLPSFGALEGYDWAPNGRSIVVSMMRDFDEAILYTMQLDGTHRRLLRAGADPSWAGDGRHIVFTLMRYRPNEPWASTINVVRPDGTRFRRLSAPGSDDDWSPSVSFGGTKVAFVSHVGWAGKWGLVDVTGADREVWPNPTVPGGRRYFCPPRWTPEGRLAVVRTDDFPASGAIGSALVSFNRAFQDERLVFSRRWTGGCDLAWQALR